MKFKNTYPCRFRKGDDGRYLVIFRDFPEALTDGADLSEAYVESRDCLEEAIAGRINRGEDIPEASNPKRGDTPVPLTPEFVLKVALYKTWKKAGLNKSEFARVIGVDEKEVRRLLDPHYCSKLPNMSDAFAALGKRVVVDIEDIPKETRT